MKFHHRCSAEQIIKDRQMRQPRMRTNGDRMLSESLANYHVQSFRQYMTEADTTGVVAGAGGTPASNAAMADDITAFSSRGQDFGADVAAQLYANRRRRNRGATDAQMELARIRQDRERLSGPNAQDYIDNFREAEGWGWLENWLGRAGARNPTNTFFREIGRPNPHNPDYWEQQGTSPEEIQRIYRRMRRNVGN